MVGIQGLTREKFAAMIDYSLLNPEATPKDLKRVCGEARRFNFNSVCINPWQIQSAKRLLGDSEVKVTSVVCYPLGASIAEAKALEAEYCIRAGADELDMVMNIGAFKAQDYDYVKGDIEGVVRVARRLGAEGGRQVIVKVIIEAGLLNDIEIDRASRLVKESEADFVKSGTGWSKPATPEQITIIRRAVGKDFGVKAAGGIREAKQVFELVKAGANRIGTSKAVQIIEQLG